MPKHPEVVWNPLLERISDPQTLTLSDPSEFGALDLSVLPSSCVRLDAGLTDDEHLALVSVLVVRGVLAIETDHPQVAKRCFDTQHAIAAGTITVLQ